MAIEHDYFGLIGDYWSERKEYGDQDVEVVLDADSDEVSSASLDAAATMVGELELIDDELRGVFVGQLDSGGSAVSHFLVAVLDGDDAEAAGDAITRDSGDRHIDALRSLSLVRVDLRPDADGDGETFAEFEFGLAPEDVEQRLVASIDIHRDLVDLRFDA
ncbi:hypothetical protein [Agromyces laixinhei]|uniref:hypothetical protein n=1 Tax=Agromyces laixinhei TaxID=2585717 RepID=UPI001115D028|nr:hypothetical protein [Agromyces laixinhei]